MEQKFIDGLQQRKIAKPFFMQIIKNMLCKETQWSCKTQFF